jgi:uncharacterized protein
MNSLCLSIDDIRSKIPLVLEQIPYLKLLVLFGSRARGDNYDETSDWDFGLLFDEDLRQQYERVNGQNCYRSWAILQNSLDLGDDEMDWIDLKGASELLAHAIARDGVVIYEHEPGLFTEFRQKNLLSKQQLKAIRQHQRIELEAAMVLWNS